MLISEFSPTQYDDLARILTAAYGGYCFDADNLRYRDETIAASYYLQRWTAAQYGKAVGFGELYQSPEMSATDALMMNVAVYPAHQNRGVGSQIYRCIIEHFEARGAACLRCSCRADNTQSVAFLSRRGFNPGMRILELQREIVRSDSDRKAHTKACSSGIEIKTMDELRSDPDRNLKLYELIMQIREDVPSPATINRITFNEFELSFVLSPTRLTEASFIAVHGATQEYVGFSDLFCAGSETLMAGVTGVKREYRYMGIASALKRCGIDFAIARNYNRITTFNAADNAAIAAVNKSTGFTETSSWLHFEMHADYITAAVTSQ